MTTLKQVELVKKDVTIEETSLGVNIYQTFKEFVGRKNVSSLPTLSFLVKETDKYAVFYNVEFNIFEECSVDWDHSVKEEPFHDVFFSCRVLDYGQMGNKLIETESAHFNEFSGKELEQLLTSLSKKPCFLFQDLLKAGYVDFYSNGFDASAFSPVALGIEII